MRLSREHGVSEALLQRAVRREVNLLDLSLQQKPRPPLPAWGLCLAAGLAVLVCWMGSEWQRAQQAQLTRQLAVLRAQISSQQQAAPTAPAPEREAALRTDATRLQAQLARLRGAQQAHALATVLEALAQATLDGVWLTQIRVDRDTGIVQLDGPTRDARLVTDYLSALARQAPFAGLAVRKVAVKPRAAQGAQSPSGFEFAIESEPQGRVPAPTALVEGAS